MHKIEFFLLLSLNGQRICHDTLNKLFLFTVAGLFASCQPAEKMWELNSPKNNLRITVAATDNGETTLVYKVDRIMDGQPIAVIENSPLGIERKDQHEQS